MSKLQFQGTQAEGLEAMFQKVFAANEPRQYQVTRIYSDGARVVGAANRSDIPARLKSEPLK